MNERIRELAKEAKAHATHLYQIGVDASFEDIFNAKFAELIVRECCKEITYASVSNEDSVFAYAYIDHLRNSFGVNKC